MLLLHTAPGLFQKLSRTWKPFHPQTCSTHHLQAAVKAQIPDHRPPQALRLPARQSIALLVDFAPPLYFSFPLHNTLIPSHHFDLSLSLDLSLSQPLSRPLSLSTSLLLLGSKHSTSNSERSRCANFKKKQRQVAAWLCLLPLAVLGTVLLPRFVRARVHPVPACANPSTHVCILAQVLPERKVRELLRHVDPSQDIDNDALSLGAFL